MINYIKYIRFLSVGATKPHRCCIHSSLLRYEPPLKFNPWITKPNPQQKEGKIRQLETAKISPHKALQILQRPASPTWLLLANVSSLSTHDRQLNSLWEIHKPHELPPRWSSMTSMLVVRGLRNLNLWSGWTLRNAKVLQQTSVRTPVNRGQALMGNLDPEVLASFECLPLNISGWTSTFCPFRTPAKG